MHAITFASPVAKPSLFPTTNSFPSARTDIDLKVDVVLAKLPQGVPFVCPRDIAPILGLSDNALRVHCRACRQLKNWSGNYRFMLDDREHVDALKALVKLVLWSGTKVPEELKPTRATAQRGAMKSH